MQYRKEVHQYTKKIFLTFPSSISLAIVLTEKFLAENIEQSFVSFPIPLYSVSHPFSEEDIHIYVTGRMDFLGRIDLEK